MSVFLPVAYITFGLISGHFFPNIRVLLAKSLTKIFIPYVIIYNIINYQPGSIIVTIYTIIFCCSLFSIKYILSSDKLEALLFSYLNIGWLGLPISVAIFGDSASRIIISAYIGSSIFGNICSVAAMQKGSSLKLIFIKTLKAPPVVAVGIGALLKVLPIDYNRYQELDYLYQIAKILMSFAGMCVLGIWLYSSKITKQSIMDSFPLVFSRIFSGSIIILLCIGVSGFFDINLITKNAAVLFILPILPPAANIVVLETYYLGTGKSASIIASGTFVSLIFLAFYALINIFVFNG